MERSTVYNIILLLLLLLCSAAAAIRRVKMFSYTKTRIFEDKTKYSVAAHAILISEGRQRRGFAYVSRAVDTW